MLDKLVKTALDRMENATRAVRENRDSLEKERAGDEARYAATTALNHPEGVTTPIKRTEKTAQQEYAKLRKEWLAQGPKLLSLAVALSVAREQRDEAVAERKRQELAELERQDTRVHPEVIDFFRWMFDHGVLPRHLANTPPHIVAIVGDIVRWFGQDPDMADPASPLPSILEIYGSRSILVPGQIGAGKRSTPGEPSRLQRYSDPVHYMFDDYLAVWRTANGHAETASGGMTADEEYALPASLNALEASRCDRLGASYLEGEPDHIEWLEEIIAKTVPHSVTQIILNVAKGKAPLGGTPARYFTEAAARSGIEAGLEAYRYATIKRLALEVAHSIYLPKRTTENGT